METPSDATEHRLHHILKKRSHFTNLFKKCLVLSCLAIGILYMCKGSLDSRPKLAPSTTFEVGKFGLALLHWGENYLRTEMVGPIKLSTWALYDDGQMINRNVINHVTKAFWFNSFSTNMAAAGELKCGD